MTGPKRLGLMACIMTLAGGTLQADVLNLADGSRIVGTLEELDQARAKLSGTFAGQLTVPRSAIVHIETTAPVTVEVGDGEYLTGRIESPEAERVVVHVAERRPRTVALADLQGVYREHPQILQRRAGVLDITATANAGVTLTSGNSETENLHVDGQVVGRSGRNRYTVGGEYIQEESREVLVKQNWSGLFKYDYFVADKWFWFTSASFASDEFADLELRSALAAGYGYQFVDSDYRSLSLELGPSYIHENFEVDEDQSYLGARWALRYEQRLWLEYTFFLYNEGLLGLEDTSDLTTRTRTGVRMDITDHIIARVQTAIVWDRSPPEGAEGTDFQHTLTVGYTF